MDYSYGSKSKTSPAPIMLMWAYGIMGLLFCQWVDGFQDLNATFYDNVESYVVSGTNPLMVGLTLINGAAAKGAVCLDGTLPGYHFHRGYGSGARNWLVMLEGGGWCNTVRNCVYRKKTRRGSSAYMEKQIPFTGILSNKAEENPDIFNWNRVKIRYCDGASFSGDSQNEAAQLYFRGQRIWSAAMEDLMSKGMRYAKQALLAGCSAGGLASILHCDEFRELFPWTTRVKCLSDGGLFLDAQNTSRSLITLISYGYFDTYGCCAVLCGIAELTYLVDALQETCLVAWLAYRECGTCQRAARNALIQFW